MPAFSQPLINRLRDYFKTKYGHNISSEEAEVFLSQLSDYFEFGSAQAERPHGRRVR